MVGLTEPLSPSRAPRRDAIAPRTSDESEMPHEWISQTPYRAITRPYGIINQTVNLAINFGTNVGAGYLTMSGIESVGLWHTPPSADHPYSWTVVADLLFTLFVWNLLAVLIARGGILRALRRGWTVPLDPSHLGSWWLRTLNAPNVIWRSLRLAVFSLVVSGGPFILLLAVVCSAGGMDGRGEQCSMAQSTYIYVKAFLATLSAAMLQPFIICMQIHPHNLSTHTIDEIEVNRKDRWRKQQERSAALLDQVLTSDQV